MVRRTLIAVLTASAVTAPARAAQAPRTETPEQVIAAVKHLLQGSTPACHTDWARIDVRGYRAHWTIAVRIRRSRAGAGTARWTIGDGWPVARNAIARVIAHHCPTG